MNIPNRLKAATQAQQSPETWEEFEDALAEIDTMVDVALLPALYECFIDGAALLPLMWQLLHLIEDFEEEASLLALVAQTPYLEEHAPNWLAVLWSRTLNGDEARSRLQYEIFPLLPADSLVAVRAYLLSEKMLEEQARNLF